MKNEIIIRNNCFNKRKITVDFPNGCSERFSTIKQALDFAENCKKDNEVIINNFIKNSFTKLAPSRWNK